jgi:hypothetical protein
VSDNARSNIGYIVAGFGAAIIGVTLWLLHSGALPVTDSRAIIIMLVVVGALLIGMGMYVVVPKETHDAVTDFGGVARDIVPKWGLRRQDDQPPPVVVHPEAGQTTVVTPPTQTTAGPEPEPVLTPPAPDPELAQGAALPLVSGLGKRRAPTPTHQISGTMRRRQELYPHDEA